MKKFNDFMFNTSSWKVAIISFVFGFCFINSLFLGLEYLFGSNIDMSLIKRIVLVASIIGLVMVGMILLFIKMANESEQFWTKAKEVELFIDEAETLEELKAIYEGEFVTLKQMSLGTPHRYEILRLLTIMDTKLKYLK